MHNNLDCIVIGYHEVSLADEIASAKQMSDQSAHLHALMTNTVGYQGRRLTYLEMLNTVATKELGEDPQLHVSAMPNLGVSYLRSFLIGAGLKVDAINFLDYERHRLERLLTENKVNSVAITTTFYTSNQPIEEIVNFVRDLSPSTKIIVGGPHILNICSYYEPDVLEYCLRVMGADFYIFDSQGESTLAQLVSALGDPQADLTAVPNLFIVGDGIERTAKAPENNGLEASQVRWSQLPREMVAPTVMMRTARSCAFKCSFCTYPVLAGDLSLMSVEAVERELLELHDLGTENISFIDDTFNVPLPRFKDMCRMMIKNKFSFRWFSYLRCGNIDEEGLDLLAAAGCTGVFLGIESGDPEVLKNMNKKAAADRYKHGIVGLRERGVETYASIIVGFPGETRESVRRTIDLLQEARPTYFHPELYCHYQFAPISGRSAEFELKGNGYSWSHKTMDWREAQECLIEMIREVGPASTYLPTYSFDFWALPYLYGQGLSPEFVRSFLAACNRQMLAGFDGEDEERHAVELAQLVRRQWPEGVGRTPSLCLT